MATYKPIRKTANGTEEIKIPYAVLADPPTIPDISGLMPKKGGTFTGEVKFGSTENFQGYYIKRMLGSLDIGTRYADLSSSYKDGTWHRMWRLRFPSGSNFWGKIKITLYGGYSSFNASGVMSKSITCNFNTSSIYNNVGCYDGLGVNVEQDFRISEAIWNDTASAWEVLIWQKNLNGNNSPVIMLECWTANNTNYIKAFNGIAAQAVELTQSTSYSAQKASSTGGTKTVMWEALPVYENPLGEEIATVSGLATVATSGSYNDLSNTPTIPTVNNGTLTIQKNGTTVKTFSANQSGNVTANITVPTKVSELTNDSGFTSNAGTITGIKMNGASKGTSGVVDLGTVITADGGTINKSKTVKMDASANSNGANLKWGTVNSKNPYIGYASDQVDGTFVVGSLLGTNYASGLAIGGGSGNLLWKGTKVATTNDIPAAVTESTVSGWGFTKNKGTVTQVKINGVTKNPNTNGLVDLGSVSASIKTLTITQNGNVLGTFDGTSDVTINIPAAQASTRVSGNDYY